MKRFLVLLAVVALFTTQAFAGVVGSKHDLRALGGGTPTGVGQLEVCVSCHTPHQNAAAAGQHPLWNHTGTATLSFGVYANSTLDSKPTDIGGAAMGAQSVSLLCMSCHDGTVSVLSQYNPPNSGVGTATAVAGRIDASGLIISNAKLGTSLADDHPINFDYTTAVALADGDLVDPATDVNVSSLLFNGSLQCASCHEVHNPTFVPFLVKSNDGSALCVTCHTM